MLCKHIHFFIPTILSTTLIHYTMSIVICFYFHCIFKNLIANDFCATRLNTFLLQTTLKHYILAKYKVTKLSTTHYYRRIYLQYLIFVIKKSHNITLADLPSHILKLLYQHTYRKDNQKSCYLVIKQTFMHLNTIILLQ